MSELYIIFKVVIVTNYNPKRKKFENRESQYTSDRRKRGSEVVGSPSPSHRQNKRRLNIHE